MSNFFWECAYLDGARRMAEIFLEELKRNHICPFGKLKKTKETKKDIDSLLSALEELIFNKCSLEEVCLRGFDDLLIEWKDGKVSNLKYEETGIDYKEVFHG